MKSGLFLFILIFSFSVLGAGRSKSNFSYDLLNNLVADAGALNINSTEDYEQAIAKNNEDLKKLRFDLYTLVATSSLDKNYPVDRSLVSDLPSANKLMQQLLMELFTNLAMGSRFSQAMDLKNTSVEFVKFFAVSTNSYGIYYYKNALVMAYLSEIDCKNKQGDLCVYSFDGLRYLLMGINPKLQRSTQISMESNPIKVALNPPSEVTTYSLDEFHQVRLISGGSLKVYLRFSNDLFDSSRSGVYNSGKLTINLDDVVEEYSNLWKDIFK